ncbi:uncharacterized protein LOC142239484 [Haematobia irritans]|uniref:uncharacterized protein LOC142239484 n=1 Tax=Haematobia irritans TaxID=7368 RepID=UPI003F4F689E
MAAFALRITTSINSHIILYISKLLTSRKDDYSNNKLVIVTQSYDLQLHRTASRRFDIEVHNLTCTSYGNVVKEKGCEFSKLATSRYEVNIFFILNRNLHQDADVRSVIKINPLRSERILPFVDLKINICDLLNAQKLSLPLASAVVKELMKRFTTPVTCPIKGNFLYNISGFKITETLFPTYTLLTKYNLSMNFYERNELFATLILHGATVPKSNN